MDHTPTRSNETYSCTVVGPKNQSKECYTSPHRYFIFMSMEEMMRYFNNKTNSDEVESVESIEL